MEAVLDGPPLGRDGSQSQKDVSRIAAHITRASQGSNVAGDRDMTSVQIWHPVAAVKSYEVDRR